MSSVRGYSDDDRLRNQSDTEAVAIEIATDDGKDGASDYEGLDTPVRRPDSHQLEDQLLAGGRSDAEGTDSESNGAMLLRKAKEARQASRAASRSQSRQSSRQSSRRSSRASSRAGGGGGSGRRSGGNARGGRISASDRSDAESRDAGTGTDTDYDSDRERIVGGRRRSARTFSLSNVQALVVDPTHSDLLHNVMGTSKADAEAEELKEDEKERRTQIRHTLADSHKRQAAQMSRPLQAILDELQSNPRTGLSSDEALRRQAKYGPNELAKDPPTPVWKMFLEQFADLLVLMLIASSIGAAFLQQFAACVVIILEVAANAALGVFQEYRAGKELDALQSMTQLRAHVLRDGHVVVVEAPELVPGDIVLLEPGVAVPADLRLLDTQDLSSTEQSLTGEPEPRKKDANYQPGNTTQKQGAEGKSTVGDKQGQGQTQQGEAEAEEEEESELLTDPHMVYMGCHIHDGRGRGVVVATGMTTKMGEIAALMSEADEHETPLQEKLTQLGSRLGLVSIVISLIVFIIGVTTGRGVDPTKEEEPRWLNMLQVAVALTVAAVPEGLPACVTVTLAIGMQRMSKKHVLISKLRSVETLGSATVICTDKTGTLTAGVMTAVRLWVAHSVYSITGAGYDPVGRFDAVDRRMATFSERAKLPLLVGALCSNATLQRASNSSSSSQWECVGNSTERPLVVAAAKAGLTADELKGHFKRVRENTFDSHRKLMSCLIDCRENNLAHLVDMKYVAVVKGAPHAVLERCQSMYTEEAGVRALSEADRNAVCDAIDDFASQSYRVLAMAYKSMESPALADADALESRLVFAGLVACVDPPRPEVAPSIVKATRAGIRTVMITGDYVKTAKAIAETIGILDKKNASDTKAIDCVRIRELGEKIATLEAQTAQLLASGVPDGGAVKRVAAEQAQLEAALDALTAQADVYARAKPIDKLTIVKSLQRQGHVCAMTGDGVNDAPALKQADIGVAMGLCGTDVAKAASHMVLTDDNFVSIVAAVEEGRTIYANITKFVYYLLSTNVAEVAVIFLAVLAGLPSPLSPIQMIWLNLVTDSTPAIALATEATEPRVMGEGPRLKTDPLLERLMVQGIAIQTAVLTGVVLAAYLIGLALHLDGHIPFNNTLIPGISDAQYDYAVKVAATMTMLVIVFAELGRAYSCRSLRISVFDLGFFSNPSMQLAVGTAVFGTVFVAIVPGVRGVFDMQYLTAGEWLLVLFLSSVPFAVDEGTKWMWRVNGTGVRPGGSAGASPHRQGGKRQHTHGHQNGGGSGSSGNGSSKRKAQASNKYTQLDDRNDEKVTSAVNGKGHSRR